MIFTALKAKIIYLIKTNAGITNEEIIEDLKEIATKDELEYLLWDLLDEEVVRNHAWMIILWCRIEYLVLHLLDDGVITPDKK